MEPDNSLGRPRLRQRWQHLQHERASWVGHWQDISEHLLPHSGRFFPADRNRGSKRSAHILDSTGTRALRVLAAGMMAGMTSPARPWFRLTTSIAELDESASVKRWLADVTRLMQMVFAKSNTYRALHAMYEELGAFGTASSVVMGNFDTVIHQHVLTCGQYALACDNLGRVNTLYREFEMTVAQLVREFGREACSQSVRNLFDAGKLETWIPVIHAIEPRADRQAGKQDAANMAYRSVHFEAGAEHNQVLRESGFKHFVALCPRWATAGGDVYGHSPAMQTLGDIRQLQHQQLRKARGIDYLTNPPLQMPLSMAGREADILPGGITYVDAAGGTGVRSAFEVKFDLSHLLADIQDVRERINASFYADLFLMLSNQRNPQMTATEVAERHEEKLLMLGPVLERLHNEILDPLVEMTFARMLEAGIVPPAPPELQGMDLNVEFVSMLAQSQRAIATSSIDRFIVGLGTIAQMKPDVLDKLDSDQWAETYADALGIDPDMVVPGEQVALIRQARAAQQQQAEQMAALEQGAGVAQKLAGADTGGQNALTDVTRAFSGYG